jgi:SAM-dependent methyltransferase
MPGANRHFLPVQFPTEVSARRRRYLHCAFLQTTIKPYFESAEVAERRNRGRSRRIALQGPATQLMLELAEVRPGKRVFDIAAGTGDQTLLAAERVGPSGYVLATDISASMLRLTAEAAREAGLTNAETRVMDAENIDLKPESFDAAVCQLGLMLFPDPAKVLRAIRRVIRSGGKVAALVFSTAEKNPIPRYYSGGGWAIWKYAAATFFPR